MPSGKKKNIKRGFVPIKEDESKFLLHEACFYGNDTKALELLRQNPALARSLDDSEQYPLQILARGKATNEQALKIAQALIETGVGDIDCKDRNIVEHYGVRTPLHIAVLKGKFGLAEYLISQGAKMDALTENNGTIFHEIAACCREEDEEVIKAKVDFVVENSEPELSERAGDEGITATFFAYQYDNLKFLKHFVTFPDFKSDPGQLQNGIITCAQFKSLAILKYLLGKLSELDRDEKNDTINAQDKDGICILFVAMMINGQGEAEEKIRRDLTVRMLLNTPYIDLSLKTEKGETFLHQAAKTKLELGLTEDMLLKMRSQGILADLINAKDAYGNTALHNACTQNDKPMVDLLRRFGADITLKNEAGQYPVTLITDQSLREFKRSLFTETLSKERQKENEAQAKLKKQEGDDVSDAMAAQIVAEEIDRKAKEAAAKAKLEEKNRNAAFKVAANNEAQRIWQVAAKAGNDAAAKKREDDKAAQEEAEARFRRAALLKEQKKVEEEYAAKKRAEAAAEAEAAKMEELKGVFRDAAVAGEAMSEYRKNRLQTAKSIAESAQKRILEAAAKRTRDAVKADATAQERARQKREERIAAASAPPGGFAATDGANSASFEEPVKGEIMTNSGAETFPDEEAMFQQAVANAGFAHGYSSPSVASTPAYFDNYGNYYDQWGNICAAPPLAVPYYTPTSSPVSYGYFSPSPTPSPVAYGYAQQPPRYGGAASYGGHPAPPPNPQASNNEILRRALDEQQRRINYLTAELQSLASELQREKSENAMLRSRFHGASKQLREFRKSDSKSSGTASLSTFGGEKPASRRRRESSKRVVSSEHLPPAAISTLKIEDTPTPPRQTASSSAASSSPASLTEGVAVLSNSPATRVEPAKKRITFANLNSRSGSESLTPSFVKFDRSPNTGDISSQNSAFKDATTLLGRHTKGDEGR